MIRISRQHLIVTLLLAVLLIANIVLTHNLFTAPFPGLNDFLSRWEGARAFWVDGLNPYGDRASLNIQLMIYGRPVAVNEDPGYFVYPFYMVFPLLPLVYLDYAWASAIWMVLLEVCLVVSALLSLRVFAWHPPPWLLALFVLWNILMYYSARGLVLGQVGIVIYTLQAAVIWALVKDHDRLAGAALAFSTLKPQMGFLIIPFLILWAVRTRRWGTIAAFAAVMAVLVAASFLLQPSWLGDWIDQMRLYPQYTAAAYPDTGSPVWIVFQHYLGLGSIGEWIVNLAFLGFMLWGWYTVLIERRDERFLWVLMVTLTVTHLVALRTATTHFVVFIIPLVFYLRQIYRRGRGWTALVLLVLLVLPWVQFLITVQGRASLEHPSLFLPPSFGLIFLLWFTRRAWWRSAPVLSARSAQLDGAYQPQGA